MDRLFFAPFLTAVLLTGCQASLDTHPAQLNAAERECNFPDTSANTSAKELTKAADTARLAARKRDLAIAAGEPIDECTRLWASNQAKFQELARAKWEIEDIENQIAAAERRKKL